MRLYSQKGELKKGSALKCVTSHVQQRKQPGSERKICNKFCLRRDKSAYRVLRRENDSIISRVRRHYS